MEIFLRRKYGATPITMWDDVKSSPAVLLDFVVDNLLLIYLILNFICSFVGNMKSDPNNFISIDEEKRPRVGEHGFVTWVDIYGAIAIVLVWITGFFKLQITKNVGPFVVYMRYCGKDLSTIFTMFVALYIPAFCVFLKTSYRQDGWLNAMFMVLRMVLIDYDYDHGKASTPVDLWWMLLSMGWIIVSSVIVLNLLIALMADSYTRIFETAELYARIERARFIMEFERTLPLKKLADYNDTIKAKYSPQIVTFDPVCDRDKVTVIEETVEALSKKFDKLEKYIDRRLLKELTNRLDNLDQSLTLYSIK